MHDRFAHSLRQDCHLSLSYLKDLPARLSGHRIAIVGGTGFLGTWIAEAVSALNDDMGCKIRLDILGRNTSAWLASNPHLSRGDITVQSTDVRSSFELAKDVTLVVFAAGNADPRLHASDPYQVFETSVVGISNSLKVASRLELIQRFVNISSGLVLGENLPNRGLSESDLGSFDFARFHNVYPEAKRAAESLVTAFAGQYRIPVSTVRPFTFIGPYQSFDAPWALNNFIRDALMGNEIKIHGDGEAVRSYLYGSDVAAWTLKLLVDGKDGEVYNFGGTEPVSHFEVATKISELVVSQPKISLKSMPENGSRNAGFYPDVTSSQKRLNVDQKITIDLAIKKSIQWNAHRLDVTRRLREDLVNK